MHLLLKDYPREAWPDHPNFSETVRHWMGAHELFRRLGDITRKNCETFLDKNVEMDGFVSKLGYYGNMLVRHLHAHHNWEDYEFFPELMRADRRFNTGIDTLESDHVLLNETLDRFTNSANRVIKLSSLDDIQVPDEVGQLTWMRTRHRGISGSSFAR